MPRFSTVNPKEFARRLALKRPEYRSTNYRKHCKGCDELLPREAFYQCVSRYDGCSNMCRPCERRRVIGHKRERAELKRTLIANGAGAYDVGKV